MRSEVKGDKMIMRASRSYDNHKRKAYAKWKPDEVFPFFVGVLHKKFDVYARSPLINMYLFEGEKEPDDMRLMRLTDKFTTEVPEAPKKEVTLSPSNSSTIIVVLAVVLVVLIGILAGFLKGKKKDDTIVVNDMEAGDTCRTDNSIPKEQA